MGAATIYVLVALGTTVWIYFDSGRFDWSGNGFFDRTWKWVVASLLLWFVVLPVYVAQRRKVPAAQAVGGLPMPAMHTEIAASTIAATPVAFDDTVKQPLLAKPLTEVEQPQRSKSLSLGLSLAVVAALAGGLLWAGIVIVTGYDVGILAWFIGAGTGLALVRFGGRPMPVAARIAAGLFAVGSLMVGEYVIFIHGVRQHYATEIRLHLISVNYLDGGQMRFFVDHLHDIVGTSYLLWAAIAFFGVWRATAGKKVVPGVSADASGKWSRR